MPLTWTSVGTPKIEMLRLADVGGVPAETQDDLRRKNNIGWASERTKPAQDNEPWRVMTLQKKKTTTLTCRIGPCAPSKKEAFSDHLVGAIIGLSRGHDTL
ncbi:hypothetical protein BN1723_013566 [Verticillium longisporum]|uniref:Uncharacterized protein n=1 Tax=Verticillium longisporum TaxID=100787 RepID=A0A0G4LTA0_VERLO|nr:hypothetical protein BN1723_013566 [Verticillium longisporum]